MIQIVFVLQKETKK